MLIYFFQKVKLLANRRLWKCLNEYHFLSTGFAVVANHKHEMCLHKLTSKILSSVGCRSFGGGISELWDIFTVFSRVFLKVFSALSCTWLNCSTFRLDIFRFLFFFFSSSEFVSGDMIWHAFFVVVVNGTHGWIYFCLFLSYFLCVGACLSSTF